MANHRNDIVVTLEHGDLEAYLSVGYDVNGEKVLTPDDALKALQDMKIVEGVMNSEIEELFRESRFNSQVLVARGIPPVDGEDGKIEYYFKVNPKYEPKEDKDGRIDFHEVEFFTSVKKGQKLCLRIPPTAGKPGRSLFGKEIKAKAGKDIALPKGPNTEIDPAGDSNLLIAALDGCVTLNDSSLVEIHPKLEIKGDVDFSTGNVNVIGALEVTGDVKAGFKVEVTGNLVVGGTVEDAEVKVNGSAMVKRGFIGHSKGLIETTGDLTLKFAQQQRISCGGDLFLGGEMMHCNTRVSGNLTAAGRKGAIIGGHAMVEGSVEVPKIGSESYPQTIVEVGCDFELTDRKLEILQELSKIDENQDKLKKVLYNLSRLKLKNNGKLPPEKSTLYERLQDTIKHYPEQREGLNMELKVIESKLSECRNVQIKCTGKVYPGVKLVIGKFQKVIDQEVERTVFREVQGEIIGSY